MGFPAYDITTRSHINDKNERGYLIDRPSTKMSQKRQALCLLIYLDGEDKLRPHKTANTNYETDSENLSDSSIQSIRRR